ERELREAVRLNPQFSQAEGNLGIALCREHRCDEGITHLQRALAIDPDAPRSQRDLAEAYASTGRMREAVDHYLNALTRQPDDVFLLNRAAWILATSTDPNVRDGAKAVPLAEHAVALSGRNNVESLDTLAAALAEAGRFGPAAAVAQEALKLANLQ